MAMIPRSEFARIVKDALGPMLEAEAAKTPAQRVLDTFIAYADLAQGWDPTAEGDWQDVVNEITQLLTPVPNDKA